MFYKQMSVFIFIKFNVTIWPLPDKRQTFVDDYFGAFINDNIISFYDSE